MQITISDNHWQVKVILKKEMKLVKGADKDTAGLCNTDDKTIYIREDYLDLPTLMHELFHAHFYYLCVDPEASVDTVEETMAIWFERRAEFVIDQAKTILAVLKGGLDEIPF